MDVFNVAISHPFQSEQVVSTAVPRHRIGEHFVKGPIPLEWLRVAATQRGHALHMAMLIWYRVGLTGSSEIKITRSISEIFGLKKDTALRALDALAAVNLIAVRKETGRAPVVKLLAHPVAQQRTCGD